MSTRTAFTVVGTVVGAYFGNAALGATIGSMVGGYVDPVKVKGPRLTDAQQQTSQDGVPIALTFGRVRIQGNVIATGELVEHKNKDGGKGSGTETTNYSYTRTYAIGICEGPIAGVSRIWKNGKLAFDGRPRTGDETIQEVHERLLLNQFLNDHVLYFGDEGQVPDSELQSVLGSDAVPAFRGLAYLVCVDEDVTTTQGAVATYEFEVVTKGSSFYGFEYVPATYPGILPFGVAPQAKADPRFTIGNYVYGPIYAGVSPVYSHPDLFGAVIEANGHFGHKPYASIPVSLGWFVGASNVQLGWNSGSALRPWKGAGWDTSFDQRTPIITLCVPRAQFTSTAADVAIGSGGAYWACAFFEEGKWGARFTGDPPPGPPSGGTTNLLSSGVEMYTVDPDLIMDADNTSGSSFCTPGEESVSYHFGDYLISVKALLGCTQYIDPSWMLVPGSTTTYVDRYGNYHSANDCDIVSGSFAQMAVLTFTEDGESYTQAPVGPILEAGSPEDTRIFWEDAYDLAVAMEQVPGGWVYGTNYPSIVSQACRCALGLTVEEGDVSLAEIVAALCSRAGLGSVEIDVSELTERVIGFTVATQTNAADTINVLAPAFFFDGSEWDGKTHFIKRGHDHVEVLTFDDSVETDDPRIKETRSQDLELPASFVLSYFDPAADLAVTTQRAARRAVTVNATGQDQLQIPVVMTSDQAAQVADMLMKDKWAALAGVLEQTIADEFSYLTPTDIVQVQSDGAIFRARLGQMTTQEGTIQYEATQDVQSAYTSDVEGLTPPTPDVGIDGPPSPTLALYFDLPALRDQDDQTGIYVAATGVSGRWSGALIEVSRDGGLSWSGLATVTQASTVGQLLTDLVEWSPYVVEEDEAFDVRLSSGTLESVTRVQLLNQENGAVVGTGEILQFQTATLLVAGQYRASGGLIRGRKNTPYAQHSANDNFAMLDSLYFLPLQRSDIGRSLKFRAVTLGTANADGIVTDFRFTEANSVTEWSVTNVRSIRDEGTGDVALAWSPRHRLGNALTPYASSFFTGYQVIVGDGSTSRTYVMTTQTFTYTAAMQMADFGAPVDPLTYTIAATNSITGAGDPTTGTV